MKYEILMALSLAVYAVKSIVEAWGSMIQKKGGADFGGLALQDRSLIGKAYQPSALLISNLRSFTPTKVFIVVARSNRVGPIRLPTARAHRVDLGSHQKSRI